MGQAHNLSTAQLIKAARMMEPQDGGFSIKSHGENAGDSPSDSYMVGIAEHGANDISIPTNAFVIEDYANKHGDVLAKPGHYLGGWHDPEKDPSEAGSLDVSRAYPRSGGLLEPMIQAYHGGKRPETAIGEVDEQGGYAGTIPVENPIIGLLKGNRSFPGHSDYE